MTGPNLRALTPNATLVANKSRKSATRDAKVTSRARLPAPMQSLLASASAIFVADLATKTRDASPWL